MSPRKFIWLTGQKYMLPTSTRCIPLIVSFFCLKPGLLKQCSISPATILPNYKKRGFQVVTHEQQYRQNQLTPNRRYPIL
ncbi:Uncharacterised protein [Legionella londiniensis]|uniref:Uncharacterized protein n=1 Tax=Legionella londiniensis TaxID=45068 RepID=A0A0W0VKL9_9GAMM|nr:hypothetical protein Llon_1534 [Legionella londiniensis]STX92881.1 Uncharacterised protein [Legionella londiniensis]